MSEPDASPDLRFVPLGAGVSFRRLRMAEAEINLFRALVASYDDGFASCHGDHTGLVYIITMSERLTDLDAWLKEVRDEIAFELIDSSDSGRCVG